MLINPFEDIQPREEVLASKREERERKRVAEEARREAEEEGKAGKKKKKKSRRGLNKVWVCVNVDDVDDDFFVDRMCGERTGVC